MTNGTSSNGGGGYMHALEMESSDDHHNHLHSHHPDDEDDYLTEDDDEYNDHVSLLGPNSNNNGTNNNGSSSSATNGSRGVQNGYKSSTSSTNRSWMKIILILAFVLIGSSIFIYKKGSKQSSSNNALENNNNNNIKNNLPPNPSPTTTTITTGEQPTSPTATIDEIPVTTTETIADNKTPDNTDGDTTTTTTTITETDSIPDDTPILQSGYKYSEVSNIIPDPDHVLIDDTMKQTIKESYGKWKFFDGDENNRPQNDYCGQYSNRDIPGDKFPSEAWQTDAVYVNHFINEAEQLIARAKEAIFDEYGHSKKNLRPEQLKDRLTMFHVDQLSTMDTIPDKYMKKRGERDTGGWTTKRSWDGLVRRLLHAIMTNDNFTVVLAGHSAAAGHGNHFHQSYMMQFHKVLAPVFARLGVKLITRNLSQGGLGTLHNSLGMRSLYGSAIDILAWDSGMTENDGVHVDVFFRQGLLSSTSKVPFLWTASTMWNVLKYLHDNTDADVGEYGTGMAGIAETIDETQVETLPYAVRYMKCSRDRQDLCQNAPRFCAKCWVQPPNSTIKQNMFTKIDTTVGSQVKWHPGWRVHQLQGRVLAFTILDALQDAIQIFSDQTMAGPPLDDSFWHVTDYYNNIRQKVIKIQNQGECSKISNNKVLPSRICGIPLQARSLFTPRVNPKETSLTSIIVPAPDDGYIPTNRDVMVYDGPDGHNQCYDIPTGQVDVLSIVSNRRRRRHRQLELNSPEYVQALPMPMSTLNGTSTQLVSRQLDGSANDPDAIIPGKGWIVLYEPPGNCDGSYNGYCGRSKSSSCPAIGHHDARGVLLGDEYSGWIVFNVPNVTHGIIIIKFMTYITSKENWKTQYWKTVNNIKTTDDTTGTAPTDATNTESDGNNKRRLFRSNSQQEHAQRYVTSSVRTDVNGTSFMGIIDIPDDEEKIVSSSFDFQQYDDVYEYPNNEENDKLRIRQGNNVYQHYQQKESRRHRHRMLGGTDVNGYPETTILDYAIDGKIKSLTKTELIAAIKKPQRVIEFVTLLDDPNFSTTRTNPSTTDPVQVAIRLRNCGRDCSIAISHLYWA